MAIFPVGMDPRRDPTRTERGWGLNSPRGESGAGPQNFTGRGRLPPRGDVTAPENTHSPLKLAAQWPNSPTYICLNHSVSPNPMFPLCSRSRCTERRRRQHGTHLSLLLFDLSSLSPSSSVKHVAASTCSAHFHDARQGKARPDARCAAAPVKEGKPPTAVATRSAPTKTTSHHRCSLNPRANLHIPSATNQY
jgi:hypothetical protein